MKDIIFNGVPWFDQNGNTVNAHGACIVREHDTYYLFGEYKTDDKNMYNGFSCYSSKNLADWKYGLQQPQRKYFTCLSRVRRGTIVPASTNFC